MTESNEEAKKSREEAGKNSEACMNRGSSSPLRSGDEAAESGCEAAEQSGIIAVMNSLISKWDTLLESDYRVSIDVDALPVRTGGNADFPPKLSIVLPVYNVEEWLGDCLRSIQAQIFTAWEAILVDDGSTDLSGKICDHFAKSDKRFRVIHQENRGVSSARNRGLSIASAPWLSFMDPDDLIPENYYSSMLQFAQQNGADWVTSDFLFFGDIKNTDKLNINRYFCEDVKTVVYHTKGEVQNHFIDLLPGGGWGFVCKRATWGNTAFPECVNIAEDMLAYMQALPKAKTVAFYKSAKYYYRKRAGSLITRPIGIERYQNMLKQSDIICNTLYKDRNEFAMTVQKTAAMFEIEYLVRAKKAMARDKKASRLRIYTDILKETRGKTLFEWGKSMYEILSRE